MFYFDSEERYRNHIFWYQQSLFQDSRLLVSTKPGCSLHSDCCSGGPRRAYLSPRYSKEKSIPLRRPKPIGWKNPCTGRGWGISDRVRNWWSDLLKSRATQKLTRS